MVQVEEIKARVSIEDFLIEQGIQLKRGRCKCPLHGGDNPTSFSVSDEVFHCFSCGESGDVVSLVQKLYGFDFKQAVTYLAEKVGLSVGGSQNGGISKSKIRPRFNQNRYSEAQIDDAIIVLERVGAMLLRSLDDELRKGVVDLARYYRDGQWIEYCLNDLDELSIFRNWQKHQMRKDKDEQRRIR